MAKITKKSGRILPTRKEFADNAKAIPMSVAGQSSFLTPKLFSTGSYGYHGQAKMFVDIGGKMVECQATFQLVALGSKDAANGDEATGS